MVMFFKDNFLLVWPISNLIAPDCRGKSDKSLHIYFNGVISRNKGYRPKYVEFLLWIPLTRINHSNLPVNHRKQFTCLNITSHRLPKLKQCLHCSAYIFCLHFGITMPVSILNGVPSIQLFRRPYSAPSSEYYSAYSRSPSELVAHCESPSHALCRGETL